MAHTTMAKKCRDSLMLVAVHSGLVHATLRMTLTPHSLVVPGPISQRRHTQLSSYYYSFAHQFVWQSSHALSHVTQRCLGRIPNTHPW